MTETAQAATPAQEPPKEPKVSTFNLKPVETQTLVILQSSHQRSFAALLSLLAQERMGYNVTENTQFKLNAEMTEIEISELPDVPVATAPPAPAATEQSQPETPPAEPKSGAVAAQ